MNWCLTHECETETSVGQNDTCLIVCCRPDAELDLDGWEFIMSLPVPDELELAQMNLSAEELRLQFEG